MGLFCGVYFGGVKGCVRLEARNQKKRLMYICRCFRTSRDVRILREYCASIVRVSRVFEMGAFPMLIFSGADSGRVRPAVFVVFKSARRSSHNCNESKMKASEQ